MHRLYVCQTCRRDEGREPGAESRGALLTRALLQLWDATALQDTLLVRVACLNGCLNACNVALRAPRKYSLRLSRLGTAHGPDILLLLRAYMDHKTGDVAEDDWPVDLKDHLSARVPPPHLLTGQK